MVVLSFLVDGQHRRRLRINRQLNTTPTTLDKIITTRRVTKKTVLPPTAKTINVTRPTPGLDARYVVVLIAGIVPSILACIGVCWYRSVHGRVRNLKGLILLKLLLDIVIGEQIH